MYSIIIKFNSNLEGIFFELQIIDTDSFIFFDSNQLNDFIEDLKHSKADFDLSDLDPTHVLYSKDKKNEK